MSPVPREVSVPPPAIAASSVLREGWFFLPVPNTDLKSCRLQGAQGIEFSPEVGALTDLG